MRKSRFTEAQIIGVSHELEAGAKTAEAAEGDFGQMKHPLSPVFHAGHAVIAAVRKATGS